MKAVKERKTRSQMNLLDGVEKDVETKKSSNEFKNQELFQYLKELTSSSRSRKGGRRCSTYSKVKDALIEKFGESTFKADKTQVQEYLRTGGKGPAPSLPPTKEEEEVESYVVETTDSKRIGLICRADGRVMWKRDKDSNLPKLSDRLLSINKIKYQGQEGQICEDVDTPISLRFSKTSSSSSSCTLPFVLVECVAYIRSHGMKVDGIFRKNGNLGQASALRDAFLNYESGKSKTSPDLELMLGMSNDGHVRTVASLLKMYFRELKDPLFPFNSYDDLIKCGPDKLAIKALVSDRDKVPQKNYDILASLMYFLQSVSKHSGVNKMTPNALSICWSQSLMRTPTSGSGDPTEILMAFAKDAGTCNSIVEVMIENVSDIFEERLLYSWL